MKQRWCLLSALLRPVATSCLHRSRSKRQDRPRERILKTKSGPTTVDAPRVISAAPATVPSVPRSARSATLEFGGGILRSVASYSDSWIETSGGDIDRSGRRAFLHHTFTNTSALPSKPKFDAKFSTTDEYRSRRRRRRLYDQRKSLVSSGTNFRFRPIPPTSSNKSWQVGSIVNSQPVRQSVTCRARSRRPTIEKYLMSPGYTSTPSGGFTYTPRAFSDHQPLADRLSAVFVESAKVRSNRWDDKPGWQATAFQYKSVLGRFLNPDRLRRTFGKRAFSLPHHALLPSWAGCRI